MTKQEFWEYIAEAIYSCNKCPVRFDKERNNCSAGCAKSLQEAYERLERESLNDYGSNNSNARKDFMDIVYDELCDDADNLRANRIIDAADEYVEEVMRLEREVE